MERMLKRIFKWFFCNLFYLNAKQKRPPSDRIIIRNIALIMMTPAIFIFYAITILLDYDPKNSKLFGLGSSVVFAIIFWIMFDRLFYRNKRYLKLMEGFSKENYNKYILLATVFFFYIIPFALAVLYAYVTR